MDSISVEGPAEAKMMEDDIDSDTSAPSLTKEEQHMCDVCHTETSKYKCPRCSKRTCSLPCVKAHKDADDCR